MRVIIGMVIGAAVGFIVGYVGKCSSGACPLTANPLISTILGAMAGGMMASS